MTKKRLYNIRNNINKNLKNNYGKYTVAVITPGGIPTLVAYGVYKFAGPCTEYVKEVARPHARNIKAAMIKRRRKKSRLKIIIGE